MKANFKLTKATQAVFIHRLNQMLNRTGFISEQSFYNRSKRNNSMLKKYGIMPTWKYPFNPAERVTETVVTYIDAEKSSVYFKEAGIGLNIGRASFLFFNYGITVRFTSNRIYIIGQAENRRSLPPSTSVVKIEPNTIQVKRAIADEEWGDRQMEGDFEIDMREEFEMFAGY